MIFHVKFLIGYSFDVCFKLFGFAKIQKKKEEIIRIWQDVDRLKWIFSAVIIKKS